MATTSTDAPGDATGPHPMPGDPLVGTGRSRRPLPDSDPESLRRLVEPDVTPTSARRSAAVESRARRALTGEVERPRQHAPPVPGSRPGRRFGYQPGLDGLRALAVIAVFLYHAGFAWMHGGWVGVEVFFVVSGFLITSLLLDEHERSSRVALGAFWLRRARRLLPALAVMLVVVATVTLAIGDAQQRGELRRDMPWALAYLANWGQILGDVPYYASDPPLLRHLWTLAIEEQFYVVWPLVFVLLMRTRLTDRAIAGVLAGVAVIAMVWTFGLHAGGPGPLGFLGGVDRVNFMYLSTFTRAGGLLLGCAAAFVWRPWRSRPAIGPETGRVLDGIGAGAVAVLGCIAGVGTLTAGYVYQWLLPMVSVLALVAVIVVVHPAAVGMRRVLGWGPLVAVGVRSYGLYLWHWPIFVLMGATDGSVARFAAALVVTIAASELCFRYVEQPVRRGTLSRWWRTAGYDRGRPLLVAGGLVAFLATCYVAVDPYDRAAGGADVSFEAPVAAVDEATAVVPGPAGPVAPVTSLAPPAKRVTIVGDSQAHSLAINLPDGIESTFVITDGSLDGCSVYDAGRVRSSRTTFDNSFAMCQGWPAKWADAVRRSRSEVALVVLGAWDVFDLETADGTVLPFATPLWDDYVRRRLQSGVDALVDAGARVGLLEVPCMRPISVQGAAVPPLPERAMDDHVAHVNALFRSVAAANPSTVTFVEGPDQWCGDPAVATDVGMRWDGVHVYKPGAKLIYDTIAPELLAL